MGDIIGGIFGAVGANNAANAQRESAQIAATAALTGFNWLTGPGSQYTQPYLNTGTSALPMVSGANNQIAELLGVKPVTQQTTDAFNNYLGSTGYNFQLDQGNNAVNSSASAKGLLQSGGTAKALQERGQNLASTTFGNYIGQLAGLAGTAQNQAALGQTAISQIGGAGSQGGGNAANALLQGGLAAANSQANMWRNVGGAVGGGVSNFLGGNGFMGGGGW